MARTSREAAGMIPGESLRSVLGEGAPATERVPGGYRRPGSEPTAGLWRPSKAFASIKQLWAL